MDVLLYIFFCDSAFNVVKAFIRGTPPSLLCDNLKCELGGACWQWREVYTTRKCGEDKENEVFAILQVLLLQEDKKTKEAAAHTEGCGTSLFPPFPKAVNLLPPGTFVNVTLH